MHDGRAVLFAVAELLVHVTTVSKVSQELNNFLAAETFHSRLRRD